MQRKRAKVPSLAPSGIAGLDLVTGGGIPRGTITTVLGGPGTGKTIFGMQFLAKGVEDQREPGIFVSFEELPARVLDNAARMGFRFAARRGPTVALVDARLPTAVLTSGDFDLGGLLAALGAQAQKIGAKRIVFDGIDALLWGLRDERQMRRELFAVRDWLDKSGITAVVTAKAPRRERLAPQLEFLEFLADCVVTLQHRVFRGTAVRTIRVVKLRGGAHSANEHPLSISEDGITVASLPRTSGDYPVSSERVSTGIARLDVMLGGGYYRGSSTLVSGAPGTAKTTLAAAFAEAACHRGERTLFVSFDEGPSQVVRNMASVGIALAPYVRSGLLRMSSLRAREHGPAAHVEHIRTLLNEHRARNLVLDPISALTITAGPELGEHAAVAMLEFARSRGVTMLSTSLLGTPAPLTETTPLGLSTIADTWMHLSYVSQGGERNRALTIVKSRGTAHSNQIRELVLSEKGVTLADVYSAGGEVLMGTLRWERERENARAAAKAKHMSRLQLRQTELAMREARIKEETARREHEVLAAELEQLRTASVEEKRIAATELLELRDRRGADAPPSRRKKP